MRFENHYKLLIYTHCRGNKMVKQKKPKKSTSDREHERWKKAGGGWHGNKWIGKPRGYHYTKRGRLYRIVKGKRRYI